MFKKVLILIVAILGFANIAQAQDNKFTVSYFYNNVRCSSCAKIEKYTKESVQGRENIEFKLINTDEPANKHFLKDYSLYTKSVVITDSKGNWKNLDKVWSLVGNEKKFKDYIRSELEDFMSANQ